MTDGIKKPTLVDCGTVRLKPDGREVRVVCLNGTYYQWDQDALDRKLGLGKYWLNNPRLSEDK